MLWRIALELQHFSKPLLEVTLSDANYVLSRLVPWRFNAVFGATWNRQSIIELLRTLSEHKRQFEVGLLAGSSLD